MKKLILSMTALAASAALAQAQQQPAPHHSAPDAGPNSGLDMNEMICRSQATIGSRLTRHRICATRQQWLDQSRSDRELAEQAQTRRTWCGGGACPP